MDVRTGGLNMKAKAREGLAVGIGDGVRLVGFRDFRLGVES